MGQNLYLKSGAKTLTSIRIMNKCTNSFIQENTVRFVADQNGEIYFEIMSHTKYNLTIF